MRASWPAAVGLILVVLVARMAYLIWFCPYELVGDEAYYWECSRHLDLCYYEKGPALPWLIAACCGAFGDTEWAIRLPVAVCSALAALVVGRTAMSLANGDGRAGFAAVAVFVLIPAFAANAQLCTQDGPMILLWALMTAAGLRAARHWHEGSLRLADTLGLAALLGLSFLFKQSALLFVLGPVLYALLNRRSLPWRVGLIGHALLAIVVFTAMISPMIAWNHQHGWPTLSHTLGHLGAPGGDHEDGKPAQFTLMWPVALIGAQLGAVGIPALLLMALACRWAWRGRHTGAVGEWRAHLWVICCSVPAVGFFVALSFTKEVIGSWPFPSYVPLVALVGAMAVSARPGSAATLGYRLAGRSAPVVGPVVVGPRGRARAGLARSLVIYGIGGWMVFSFPDMLARIPAVGAAFEHSVIKRVSGHRQKAAQLAALAAANRDPAGRPPLIIARYYMEAALAQFYLPGHPIVYNAGTLTGQRPTSYDYFADNDLTAPALHGRWAILDGLPTNHPWAEVLRFDSITAVAGTKLSVARGYGGVR